MNQDRRAVFVGAAVLVPLALSGCAADGTPSADTQAVFNKIQWLLPTVSVLATAIALAVPGAAPILSQVGPILALAADEFQKLQANMTAAAAKPLVGKIATYVGQALDLVQSQAAAAPAGSRLSMLQPELAEARQVFDAVVVFATGVEAMPTAARRPMPRLLHR